MKLNPRNYLLLSILLLMWAVYFVYKPQFWPFIQSDGYGYHVWVRHLLMADFSFCGEMATSKPYSHTFASLQPATGICTNMYPPGIGIAKLPIALFGPLTMDSQSDPTKYEQYASLSLALILFGITTWLCARIAHQLGASTAATQYSLGTMFIGSGLFHYSSFMSSFSHVYSAFWSVLALASLLSGRRFMGLLGGVAGTMLFLTRATNVIFFPLLAAALFMILRNKQHPTADWRATLLDRSFYSRLFPFFAGGFLGMCLQVLLNSYSFGTLTFSSYAASGSFSIGAEQAFNVLRVLFSPGNGVITYQPIIAASIFALFLTRDTRWFGILASASFVFCLLIYSTWVDWHLGSTFGHRGFVELTPVIGIALAISLTRMRTKMRLILIGLTTVSAALTTALMLSSWSFSLPITGATRDQFISAATGSFLRADQWAMLLGSLAIWFLSALELSKQPHRIQ